jgi:hypothetical protein
MNHSRMRALFLLAVLAVTGCILPLGGQGGEGGAQVDTAPTVSSTDPKDAVREAELGTKVNAVFSEAMDPSTVTGATFTLTQGGAAVAGAVTYSGVAATFTPASPRLPLSRSARATRRQSRPGSRTWRTTLWPPITPGASRRALSPTPPCRPSTPRARRTLPRTSTPTRSSA